MAVIARHNQWYKEIVEKRKQKNIRYIFLSGGRASGKTTEVATDLIKIALQATDSFIILCCREIQKSLKESTCGALQKAVKKMKLEKYFKFKKDNKEAIICKHNGVKFVFEGLHANPESVKSIEDAEYCWVEEAQCVSEESLHLLMPSIGRKQHGRGRLFFTWNPRYKDDPIERIKDYYQAYAVHKHITYKDNQFFPRGMDIERKVCEQQMPELYPHIWGGDYLKRKVGLYVMPLEELEQCVGAGERVRYNINRRYQVFGGLDLSDEGTDYPAFAIKKGSALLDVGLLKKGKAYDIIKEVIPIFTERSVNCCYYDATGCGAGAKSEFYRIDRECKQRGIKGLSFTTNPIIFHSSVEGQKTIYLGELTNKDYFSYINSQLYFNLRLRMKNTLRLLEGTRKNPEYCLFLPKNIDKKVLQELAQITYSFDKKVTVDKKGGASKSPDQADAIALAFKKDIELGLSILS